LSLHSTALLDRLNQTASFRKCPRIEVHLWSFFGTPYYTPMAQPTNQRRRTIRHTCRIAGLLDLATATFFDIKPSQACKPCGSSIENVSASSLTTSELSNRKFCDFSGRPATFGALQVLLMQDRRIEHRPDGSTRGVRHISRGEDTLPRYASAWVFRRADDAGPQRVILLRA
jgi:hypothetical protein